VVKLAGVIALTLASIASLRALPVEILKSVGGLPPHIVGTFEDAIGFQQSTAGTYYVLDRRAQSVHAVDSGRTVVKPLVEIGQEQGRVIQPFGFDVAPDGQFVVADAPRNQQRLQTFAADGKRLGGFFLPGRPAARIELGNLVLNGASSIQHVGDRLIISHPESGALFTEYTLAGFATRSVGRLRDTGFEGERDLHIALNTGLALSDPTGGFYYVFITGRPMFRKYDARGMLMYERHIQGAELDALLDAQPTRWPRRRIQDREVPYVTPVIRAAAVDPQGHLWVSLSLPYTYVFDRQGDKARTIQFMAAGVVSPTSLFFTRAGRLLVTPGLYEFDPLK
jgi:hypothetical protein